MAKWCINGTEHDFVGPVQSYSGGWGYYCEHCNDWRFASVVGGRVLDRKRADQATSSELAESGSKPVQGRLFRDV